MLKQAEETISGCCNILRGLSLFILYIRILKSALALSIIFKFLVLQFTSKISD